MTDPFNSPGAKAPPKPFTVEEGVRRVRSFVLRQGRFTPAQQRAFDERWPRFGLDYSGQPRDLDAVFGRTAPKVLEIGTGNGDALRFAEQGLERLRLAQQGGRRAGRQGTKGHGAKPGEWGGILANRLRRFLSRRSGAPPRVCPAGGQGAPRLARRPSVPHVRPVTTARLFSPAFPGRMPPSLPKRRHWVLRGVPSISTDGRPSRYVCAFVEKTLWKQERA